MSSVVTQAMQALLREQGSFASSELSERTGRSRQALGRHIKRWLDEGTLVRLGGGRSTRYERPGAEFECTYATGGLDESRVWYELREAFPVLEQAEHSNAEQVLAYIVTELVNNAIDHSGAQELTVQMSRRGDLMLFRVRDAGIGAFERVRSQLGLSDHLHALHNLSKGKLTTQPERHSGEGLFFSSKAADYFDLRANGLRWVVDNDLDDHAIGETADLPGTEVRVELRLDTTRDLKSLFDEYTTDLQFDRSVFTVSLLSHGTRFISRSEAKRLVEGLERFREVILDFHGVDLLGQGFVDQVFRVWATQHPEVTLTPRNMNEAVEFMVKRGLP